MVFSTLRKLAPALLLVAAATEGAFATLARRSDARIHANMPPRPSVPIVGVDDANARTGAQAPVTSRNGTVLPPYTTTYYFDQLVDHNDPSRGTFQQRYWHTYEFYETGGPIVLFTPGEANAQPYTGYLTNRTINGQIAQAHNGAAIVLEHRFYGLSNPLPDLSGKSLKLHTIQQAIDDLEYFAKNVVLPQPDGSNVKPGQAPWVLVGGSYSGALTSFAMTNKPGLFQAGYASSAVVESIVDFYGYFTPIREGMAKNCSADVQAVIAHVDSVFTSGNQKAINNLLAMFNMTPLADHLDDAAGALRNNLWDWQSLSPTSGYGTFFQFCDALEVKNGKAAGPGGWGLTHALQAWSTFWTQTYYPNLCGTQDVVSCLGTYDPTQAYWTDTSIDNAGRSWFWIVCNEVGFFQDGPPVGQPALVSRLTKPASDERQCTYMFPDVFTSPPVPDVAATNKAYDGWFTATQNLFFANGHRDPWRDATKSAEGTHFESTAGQPIAISDGFHCSDLSTANAVADATVLGVQQAALVAIAGWLAEWKPS